MTRMVLLAFGVASLSGCFVLLEPDNDGAELDHIGALIGAPMAENGGAEVCTNAGCQEVFSFESARLQAAQGWGPHLSGSSIALTEDQQRLLIADSDNNALVVVDLATETPHAIPVGARPYELVVGPGGKAYVSLKGGDAIAIVDIEAMEQVGVIKTGVSPEGVALSPDGDTLYVTQPSTQSLHAIRTDDHATAWRIALPHDPRGIAVAPDGSSVYVAHLAPGQVSQVHIEGGEPTDVDARALGAHPAMPTVFDNGNLTPNLARVAVMAPEGDRVIVPHVVVDTEATGGGERDVGDGGCGGDCDFSYGSSLRPPAKPTITMLHPDGGRATTADRVGNGQMPTDPRSSDVFGEATGFGVESVLAVHNPVAAAHHPNQSLLFVAMEGTDNIIVYNTATSMAAFEIMATYEVEGRTPGVGVRGIAIKSDGMKAFVHNAFDHSVAVLDLGPLVRGRTHRNFKAKRTFRISDDLTPSDFAIGRRLFHSASDTDVTGDRRIACSTCHPDGGTDRLVWLFPSGHRNVPSLAGRLPNTEPLNWSGDTDTLETNVVHSISRMGGAGLGDGRLQALSAYLSHGMERPGNPNASDGAKVREGEELFHDPGVGCAGCHTGERKTDNRHHDFTGGQRRSINTPSLTDLHFSAPYMHDGRFETLGELLRNNNDRMGRTSHLDAGQLAALEAYIKTL